MENEKTELTGGYRSSEENLESSVPVSSRVDPTHTMPPDLNEPDWDSMNETQAGEAYEKLHQDRIDGKNRWSTEKYTNVTQRLFRKAYSSKLEANKRAEAEAGRQRAEEARTKLQDFTDELHQKRTEKVLKERWDQNTESEIKFVQNFVLKNASQGFIDYLDETRLGDNPNVIFFAHGLAKLCEAYPGSSSFIIPHMERAVREFVGEVQRKKVEKTELTRRGGRNR